MEVMGVKFAPLNIPSRRRAQTLAEAAVMWIPILVFNISMAFMVFLFFTPFCFIPILYLIWIWLIDKNTPEKGGRRIENLANWKLFKISRDYYPITLKLHPDLKLDPKRNYLFCSFPHGIMSKGVLSTIITNAHNFNKLFPHHQRNFITLPLNFNIPIYRDYVLALGGCSSSAKSIDYLLKYPGGGQITVLVVGGAEEAFYARPGPYRIVLKNRKGFVRLALMNGSPLVPIFAFGENDLFKQISNPKGSLLRRFQEWVKSKVGATPIIFYGRGILQYSFGFIPLRKPINVVIGKPIEVVRKVNPTQDDIDSLHNIFISELKALFDKYKHHYIENPDEHPLIII